MFPLHPDPTAPPSLRSPAPAPRRESDQILAELIAGNRRFLAGHPLVPSDQRPYAAVMGCVDARVPVELVFDQGVGRLCVIRTAGHVLDQAALASMELAVSALGVRLVVVLGHRRCLAVAAALDARRTGRRPAGSLGFVTDEIGRSITGSDDPADAVTRRHVARTVARLRAILVAGRSDREPVRIAGVVYDVDTGWVHPL
jgi:carbonic anhydrase